MATKVSDNMLKEGVAIPPGAVMSFAMSAAPIGWLACDGTSKAVSDFQPLFAAIGYTYGGSSSNFNVPNLQGQFVRGLTTNLSTASRDPLSATRVLGNVQNDAFQSHIHTYSYLGIQQSVSNNSYSTPAGQYFLGSNLNTSTPTSDNINGTPRATNETRPVNIALLFCIKT